MATSLQATVLFAAPTQEFNLGSALLAECLRKAGCPGDVTVCVRYYGRAFREVDVSFIRDVLLHKPQVLALSCYFWNFEENLRLARLAKQLRPEIRIVLGGPQVGTVSDALHLAEREEAIDAVFCGEADETLPEYVLAVIGRAPLRKLPGAIERRANSLEIGEPTLPIPDLKKLPRVFYAANPYLASFPPESLFTIQTLRGCRNHCSYCIYALPDLRFFPLDRIEEEVAFLCELGAHRVRIADSHFGGSRDRAMNLFEIIQKHNRDTTFSFYPDPAHLSSEYLRAAERANCRIISLGSGASPGLAAVDSPSASQAKLRALSLAATHGQRPQVDLMYGLPGQTPEDLAGDVSTLLHAGAAQLLFSPLMAFPGTALNTDLSAKGLTVLASPQRFVYDTAQGLAGYAQSLLVAETYACLKVLGRAESFLLSHRPLSFTKLSPAQRASVLKLAEALRFHTGTSIRQHLRQLTTAATQLMLDLFQSPPQFEGFLAGLVRFDLLEHAMRQRSAEIARSIFQPHQAPRVFFAEDHDDVHWRLHPEAWLETCLALPGGTLPAPEQIAVDGELPHVFFCVTASSWELEPLDFQYLRELGEASLPNRAMLPRPIPRMLLKKWATRGVLLPTERAGSGTYSSPIGRNGEKT